MRRVGVCLVVFQKRALIFVPFSTMLGPMMILNLQKRSLQGEFLAYSRFSYIEGQKHDLNSGHPESFGFSMCDKIAANTNSVILINL